MDRIDGIEAVAFDLYGTLLEVASVGRAAAEVTEDPAVLVDLWRTKQLEYTWLRSLMGRYRDFWSVTADALDYSLERLRITVDDDTRARLLGAWLDVRVYPEVPGALEALAPRRLAVLSNGNPDMLEAGLAAAGLRDRFAHVLSVDEVSVFKPHPSVYELALKAFNLPAERILFVSSNPWDASGARTFGLPVAWVNRAGGPFERLGVTPDLVVTDLAGLAEAVA
ncbi:MAG: haloacid dehalogenase type II [Actinomycetota bacterium]